jgi:hypothetical protein
MDKEIHTVLSTLTDNVMRELRTLNKKDTLSATEIKAAVDSLCLLIKIEEYKSMHDSNSMMENGESYGYGMSMRPAIHGTMHYDDHYDMNRSPVTGNYIRRDTGYSSHSLNDRMIAKLETMYDEAKSEYEREEIRKEIDRIRNRSN